MKTLAIRPILAAILLLICATAFAQDKKPKLLISVSGELPIDVADALMDGISYGLKNNDDYEILINDRQFRKTLKKEWNKGNISDDRIIALAKMEGADHLCFTKINTIKGLKGKQVKAQIYDLTTMSFTNKIGMEPIEDDFSNMKHFTEITLNVVKDMLGTAKSKNIKTFTDPRDNKQYKMVTIGDQTWMAENLNYNASGSKCYDYKESNCQKYGRLYNLITAMEIDTTNKVWFTMDKKQHQGICPKVWHLPSAEEWEELVGIAGGRKKAGKKLISAEFNGTDDYGFSALLGGECYPIEQCKTCYDKECKNVGSKGVWYTSSLDDCGEGANVEYVEDSEIKSGCGNIWIYYSVRCIKD